VSRIRPIGDDDDDVCGDGPQNVGQGCADFTPSDDDGRRQLQHAARFILRMRKAGATYVKVGELEASFISPEAAKSE